jgi:hypothetical protein
MSVCLFVPSWESIRRQPTERLLADLFSVLLKAEPPKDLTNRFDCDRYAGACRTAHMVMDVLMYERGVGIPKKPFSVVDFCPLRSKE